MNEKEKEKLRDSLAGLYACIFVFGEPGLLWGGGEGKGLVESRKGERFG